MDKRKLTVILISIASLLVLATAVYFLNSKFHFLADTNNSLELYGVSPNEKLIKGMDLTENKNGYAVTIAKNEYEPFVVAVKNTSDISRTVKLTKPVLEGYKFEFYSVKFVDFGYEGYYQRELAPELYADPLVSIDNGGEIAIPENSEEFVWVNVFAEKNVTKGNKQANINFGTGGNFNVKINQIDVALPDKSTFSNMVDMWPTYAYSAHGYKDGTETEKSEIVNKYTEEFSAHRTSPNFYPWSSLSSYYPDAQVYWRLPEHDVTNKVDIDFSRLTPKIASIKAAGYKNYNIAPYALVKDPKTAVITLQLSSKRPGVLPANEITLTCTDIANCPEYDLAVTQYFTQWNDYLINNNLMSDAIYYLVDEPGTNVLEYPKLGHLASLIKQAAPSLKIAFTYYAQDTWTLGKLVESLGDTADIWIPHINSAEAVNPKSYLPAGKEYWIYDTSTVYRTDSRPEQYRLMPWMAYKLGASGNIYWASNHYRMDGPWKPQGEYRYGTNYLFYSPTVNMDWVAGSANTNASAESMEIVKSIRFEMVREGEEDLELIKLLETQKGQNADTQALLAKVKQVYSPFAFGQPAKSYKFYDYQSSMILEGWKFWPECFTIGTVKKGCLYANRETDPDPPGFGSTDPGKATVTISGITPGKYTAYLHMAQYTSYWASTTAKPQGSAFKMRINDGGQKEYNNYINVLSTWPTWVKNFWTDNKNTAFLLGNGLYELPDVVEVGTDGNLKLEFESVEGYRAVLSQVQLRPVAGDFGTASLMSQVKTTLNAVDSATFVDAFNVSNNQKITSNPYMLSVKVKDPSKVAKVEYYIDNILVGTSTLPDVNGVFDWPWDTSKYHSIVKIIVYGTDGQTEELARNTTVDLTGNQDPPIVIVLPKTGENSIAKKVLDALEFIATETKKLF